MNLRFASVLVSSVIATAAVAQQQQSPFTSPAVNQPTAGQTTTSANQGIATNPTGDANTGAQQPAAGAGGVATNATGGSAFGLGATNQVGAALGANATSPLFLNVTATTITDANGSPIGVLQQLALSPSGAVNFGVVNMGGRLVPVPWQLIVSGTSGARGTLAINADAGLVQRAPPVLMGQLPTLSQDAVQAQILNHFGIQQPATTQPTVVPAGTARGGTGGAGVTITGGNSSTAQGTTGGSGITITGGNTNAASLGTTFTNNMRTNGLPNTNNLPNTTRTNQAVNTTSGLLSPTGRTNGIYDGYNSGPGSFDRLGPRENANPTQPRPVPPPPANSGQQPQR